MANRNGKEIHPSDEALLAYSEAREIDGVDPRVQRHLDDGCRRCRTAVERFQEILATLQAPQLERVPEAFRQAAMERIWELDQERAGVADRIRDAVDAVVEGADQVLREVRMGLMLDSALGASLPGIRGATAMQPRQLLFESPEGSVHLRIRKGATGKLDVMGQFLPTEGDLEGKNRVILEHGKKRTPHRLSSTGEFRFTSVTPGRVQFCVEWKDAVLMAGPLDLSEDPDA